MNNEGIVAGSIREGWEAFKRQPWLMIGALLTLMLASLPFSLVSAQFMDQGRQTVFSGLINALSVFVTLPVGAGVAYLALRLVRRDPGATYATVFSGFGQIVDLLIAGIVTGVIVTIGFVLLIVPGIMAGLGLMLAQYLVMDRGMKGMDAVKESWERMKGHKMDAFLLALASIAIVLAGVIACFVGIFVAVPVVIGAQAAFYNRVMGESTPPSSASSDPMLVS